MARLDIHRPSQITVADYEFVAFDYYGPDAFGLGLEADRMFFRQHMERTGGKFSGHEHGGTCHICGASAMYVAKFYHAKTNKYIVTGQDCADNMMFGIDANFRHFRERIRAGIELKAGKTKAQQTLGELGLSAAFDVYTTQQESSRFEHKTICDIIGRLVQYGSVSDKQIAFVRNLVAKLPQLAEIDAARAAEKEAAAPVPVTEDRIKIAGTIVSIKHPQPDDYIQVMRMIVKTVEGFVLMGTLPSALTDQDRGKSVVFSARVKPSKNDPKFGYYSRPTKVEVK